MQQSIDTFKKLADDVIDNHGEDVWLKSLESAALNYLVNEAESEAAKFVRYVQNKVTALLNKSTD